jgi:hypothetical protein
VKKNLEKEINRRLIRLGATNPDIPDLDEKENTVNRRADIADKTGLVFPLE